MSQASGWTFACCASWLRRGQFGSPAVMSLPVSVLPAQWRHQSADSKASESTDAPTFNLSRATGTMNFGCRFDPSKASRGMVSPIFGLEKRRWIRW